MNYYIVAQLELHLALAALSLLVREDQTVYGRLVGVTRDNMVVLNIRDIGINDFEKPVLELYGSLSEAKPYILHGN